MPTDVHSSLTNVAIEGHRSQKPLTVLDPATDAAMTSLQRHILQLAPTFNFETDAVAARISKFPELKAELSRCTSQGVYIWQYSRCPAALPALPTAPIAAAATADEVAPERKDAQFCWLAAPVPWRLCQHHLLSKHQLSREGRCLRRTGSCMDTSRTTRTLPH
jgi:hypothetical protein